MKKDIKKLVKEVFRDELFFRALGFSDQESIMLNLLVQGQSVSTIADMMDLSYSVVLTMKTRCLYLLPLYMHRRLDQNNVNDLKLIHSQLSVLNDSVNSYLEKLGQVIVYEIKELNISKRTINSLTASNIKNTNDLTSLSRKQLTQIKSLGEQGIVEIELELNRLNLRLKKPRSEY